MANGTVPADSVELANLDREQTRNNADYSAFKKEFTFDWRKIRTSIGKGEAAIEFVEMPEIAGESISRIQYAAIVITKDSKNPDIIPLCDKYNLMGTDYINIIISTLKIILCCKLVLFDKYLFESGNIVLLVKEQHRFFIIH